MRLINADKLYPDVLSNKGLAISQSQIANAPTVDAIVISDNMTNGDLIKGITERDPLVDTFGNPYEVFDKDWWDALYKKQSQDIDKVLKVLRTERECVSRNCDRDCAKCDLVMETRDILYALDTAIELLTTRS